MAEVRIVTFEIPEELAQEAEALGLDVVEAYRAGFALTMYRTRRDFEWKEENREAIQAFNSWLEKNGHPLERYRLV